MLKAYKQAGLLHNSHFPNPGTALPSCLDYSRLSPPVTSSSLRHEDCI